MNKQPEKEVVDMNYLLEGIFQLTTKIRETDGEEGEIVKEVQAWGTSAHIPISKKHTGRLAKVSFIPKEEIESVEKMLKGFQEQKYKEDSPKKK